MTTSQQTDSGPRLSYRSRAYVHIQEPGHGIVVFSPDDDLPDWAVQHLLEFNPSILVKHGDEAPRSEQQ